MRKQDLLRESFASLGVAFTHRSTRAFAPEDALVYLVKSGEFPEDKKLMSMALTWLQEHSALVHVERLLGLMKGLTPNELALLGAIANKCVTYGDHRWKTIELTALKVVRKSHIDVVSDDPFLIKRHGVDKSFEKFKMSVAQIALDSDKKFRNWEETLRSNPWLRFRLLFGANLRADVATVIHLELASTAYAAAKLLGSSMSAVYKNWADLKEAGWHQNSRHF